MSWLILSRSALAIATLSVAFPLSVHALDLNEVYQLGLKNDPQYASALANYRVVQERIPQAAAALKPTLNWNIGASATLSKSLGTTTTGEVSDISRTYQTDTQNSSSTNTTTEGRNNFISTSGTNKTDSTTASLLKESSNTSSTNDGWTEPLQTNRNRSLASALAFSMPLYRPALNAQLEQSKLIVKQAELQLQAAKADMMLRVSQAYFEVVIAEENIIAISAQKIATVQQLESARQHFEVGSATLTDIHEAQARFDLVRAQEISAANELRVKTSALRAMIGVLPSPVLRLKTGSLSLSAPSPEHIDAWVELAERHSYGVLIQKAALQVAQQEIVKQNAAYKPTVNLTANAGVNRAYARNVNESIGSNSLVSTSQTNSNTTTNSTSNATGNSGTGFNSTINSSSTANSVTDATSLSNTAAQTNTNSSSSFIKSRTFEKSASIGIHFVMPLYQGGLIDSRVREAIAQQDKVSADLESALASAILNVNKSFFGVMSGLAQVSAFEVAVTSNEMAVNSNKLGYEVGMRLNIDVLNAQQQLFATRRDLARARVDTVLNGLLLKAAVGNLNEADIQTANQWLTPKN